jgi:hypothetical protein
MKSVLSPSRPCVCFKGSHVRLVKAVGAFMLDSGEFRGQTGGQGSSQKIEI